MSSQGSNLAGMNFANQETVHPIIRYRNKNMCNKWNNINYEFNQCDVNCAINPHGNVKVKGIVKAEMGELINIIGGVIVKYWAAAPPECGQSYTGSGRPFPNPEIAFEKTPNKGYAKVEGNEFNLVLKLPNSYYKDCGRILIPPAVRFKLCDSRGTTLSKVYTIHLGEPIPFRAETWDNKRDWNEGPLFYCDEGLPIRTQEQILRDSAYPKVMAEPPNFWGLKPTH